MEKAAYHKNADVIFQNSWADQNFCMEWALKSYRQSLMRGRTQLARADNLHAQATDESKEYLSKHCNMLAWFLSANATDELHHVDVEAGRMTTVEVAK